MLFTPIIEDSPEDLFEWKTVEVKVEDKNGVVYYHPAVEVPKEWSANAAQTLASKYFFRGADDVHIQTLTDSVGVEAVDKDKDAPPGEWSLKQVATRTSEHWAHTGLSHGYFDSEEETELFAKNIRYCLYKQYFAPNSPQWFNTGVLLYGVTGSQDGNWIIEGTNGGVPKTNFGSYQHPPVMACHLKSVEDSMFGKNSITDFWVSEARLFKAGSGNGANWFRIRGKGEPLSAGGVSSGLMSFLKVPDVAAGAIKSGGTTRRAAKLVSVDLDHPEILEFINWKAKEERKAIALADHGFGFGWNEEGGVYESISGQNSNNSVAIPASFQQVRSQDLDWYLIGRIPIDPEKIERIGKEKQHPQGAVQQIKPIKHGSYKVSTIIYYKGASGVQWYPVLNSLDPDHILDEIAKSAWQCADPGVHFIDWFEYWNPVRNDGEVKQTNPCSEYLHLENTSCNLVCANLKKIESESTLSKIFTYMTILLDITVSMASLPSKELAWGAYNYRSLGLGFAGLGAKLMDMGIAYDSDQGRTYAARISALETLRAWETSAELAEKLGPFPRYNENKEHIDRILEQHAEAVEKILPHEINIANRFRALKGTPMRNSFVTLVMPAGTTGLILDADTTGIEPFFGLKTWKTLAGGGGMEIVCNSVENALGSLDYDSKTNKILKFIEEHGNIENCPEIRDEDLPVFDTATPNLVGGRALNWKAHIKMLGAVQPFISGAVSKTINMPNNATVDDIKDAYDMCHRLGIKCVAIYRDGCKMSQPLNIKGASSDPILRTAKDLVKIGRDDQDLRDMIARREQINDIASTIVSYMTEKPIDFWHLLQNNWSGLEIGHDRPSYTTEFTILSRLGKRKFHLTVGTTENGEPIEVFLRGGVGGNFEAAVVDVLGISISYLLQTGMPLKRLCKKFILEKMRFEPMGMTDRPENSPDMRFANNVIEMVLKIMARKHLSNAELGMLGLEEVQHKETIEKAPEPKKTAEEIPIDIELGKKPCASCGHLVPIVGCDPCPKCGFKPGGCGG